MGDCGMYSLRAVSFVAFDVETTGLNALTDGIVEVGAVRFDRQGARGVFEQLINPGRPVPPDVSAIHGITDEMVLTAPPIGAALPRLAQFLGDSVLVAHNAPFDIGFLERAFAEGGIRPPKNLVLCTKNLARALFRGLRGYGLSAVARHLGVPLAGHHRALQDAGCCAEIFRRSVGVLPLSWDTSVAELVRICGGAYRFAPESGATLQWLETAIKDGTTIRIQYRSASGAVTDREITPQRIEGSGRRTKVIAYCHLRRENRTFRLDCITGVTGNGPKEE